VLCLHHRFSTDAILELPYYYLSAVRTKFSFAVGGGSLVKYGWLRACDAENRIFGSSARIDLSNEIASFGAAVKISSNGMAVVSSHCSPRAHSGRAWWSGQFVSFGVPKTVKIVSYSKERTRMRVSG